MRRRSALALVALVALVLAGCSRPVAAPTLADIGLADIGTVAAAATAAADAGPSSAPVPAAELRLHLEHLLGHHAVLTA